MTGDELRICPDVLGPLAVLECGKREAARIASENLRFTQNLEFACLSAEVPRTYIFLTAILPHMNRRTYIGTVGTALIGGVAGCGALDSDEQYSLSILNDATESHTFTVEVNEGAFPFPFYVETFEVDAEAEVRDHPISGETPEGRPIDDQTPVLLKVTVDDDLEYFFPGPHRWKTRGLSPRWPRFILFRRWSML